MSEDTSSDTMLPPELTLVVAATRNMGIGRNGTLPWTGLRKEMAYFARVTKRLPTDAQPPAANAVIMGRKTWDSIPPRFRPLAGRLNLVISRGHAASSSPPPPAVVASSPPPNPAEPVRVASLEQAVAYLQQARTGTAGAGRAFVIGGAQIYGAALRLPAARRVLLTRVLGDFECDTFFPLRLDEDEDEAAQGEGGQRAKWVRRSKEELDAWTGETVPEGIQEENGTQYEFQMWERVD
ncbi:dihydrofolate reductase [Xylariomycetidae sp. FL0641]|nr:dihydrofolate reductase [Xylariomycetidae sp. FL0641]